MVYNRAISIAETVSAGYMFMTHLYSVLQNLSEGTIYIHLTNGTHSNHDTTVTEIIDVNA